MTAPPRNPDRPLTREALKTPRAAAIAGIVFAVLFTISVVLSRLAIPAELGAQDASAWLAANSGNVQLALSLLPFAGIAFLWFVGVVRDRLGAREDQFFSTVFFGSGLLFLAMIFASAALGGGILASFARGVDPATLAGSVVYTYGRAVMFTLMNVYAVRMAGVFMISLGSLWLRTRAMPRLAVFLTYGLAVVMLVSISSSLWLILVFPAWVFGVSIFILIETGRGKPSEAEEILGGAVG
jgi:hypothetical protein